MVPRTGRWADTHAVALIVASLVQWVQPALIAAVYDAHESSMMESGVERGFCGTVVEKVHESR